MGLLSNLRGERDAVEEADIKEQEAEIDHIVYNLFNLNDNEREVIKKYLKIS